MSKIEAANKLLLLVKNNEYNSKYDYGDNHKTELVHKFSYVSRKRI